ncbi:ribbon-helix-helix protein, CopG family [Rudaeicoccus suwonensis]|uniref:Ribbon-helix-helix CopG family protein n=1 Tax=Rudaeicoccus suwonensis TaxID=657409 RepID=A0A561E4G4_9MICO|nr:ribbon-helix-helix protein, CopG family [Rudaeicoccus suwonensis]TWE10503.1 ribbon-helix-helix CopG family protein [Rudaeicoccus suwonensis]
MSTEIDYDALAARLTDPDYPVSSAGQVKTGDAAAAEGRAFLLREYGSEEAIAAAMSVSRGRPRVGDAKRGPSATVRGRISDTDYAAFKKLEEATGRTQSDLVRDAVHQLLTQHKLVS